VYAFERISGPSATPTDLIDYEPIGDGFPDSCKPSGTAACGTITAPALDFDGQSPTDIDAYRLDFYGNWTIDKWMIGETSPCPAPPATCEQDMVDIFKWRIYSPGETERIWDLQIGRSCGTFRGYIDGSVRVVRDVQGAASGAATRKVEFFYPGEFVRRAFLRVHPVQGPIWTYPDLQQSNVSSPANALVYRQGFTSSNFDEVNGQPKSGDIAMNEWYQVSSSKGSFLSRPGDHRFPSMTVHGRDGQYDDTNETTWPFPPDDQLPAAEWEFEPGEKGVLFHKWGTEGFQDTQQRQCLDPYDDNFTPIYEIGYVMLSSGEAAGTAGQQEMTRRNQALTQCIEEEQRDGTGGPGTPCTPVLQASYNNDGGTVNLSVDLSGCQSTVLGWTLLQSTGGGGSIRRASLGPGQSFKDGNLVLNEERTYTATTFVAGCIESEESTAITVSHIDTTAPPAPGNPSASVAGTTVTVSWEQPAAGDIGGYKVLASSQSGGPYTQTHTGLISRTKLSKTFEAIPGQNHYIVVKAVDVASNESGVSTEVQVYVP
jgi:hypothetical protein